MEKGVHYIAAQDIQQSELLLIEEPIVYSDEIKLHENQDFSLFMDFLKKCKNTAKISHMID